MHLPMSVVTAIFAAAPGVLACLFLAACGAEMVPSPYPAARATEPVEDDSGLQGTAIAGASGAISGDGGSGGTTVDPDGDGGGTAGGGEQDGNIMTTQAQVNLGAAGRHGLARGAGEGQWVAGLQPQARHYRLHLWPRSSATTAAERAGAWPSFEPPVLMLDVPRQAPLGTQMEADVRATAAASSPWWGRVRLDALPTSPTRGAAVGEFEVHGPTGSWAGRFRAPAGPSPGP